VELALFTEPEWAARLALYEAGELDVQQLWMLSLLEADRARQRHAGEYFTGPMLATECMWYDMSRPPFDDVRVRRAFVMAVDREKLYVAVRGYGDPISGGFLPPGMPGHTPGLSLPFDPAEARRLLAAAGYAEGRGLPHIDVTTWAWPGNEVVCAFLQAQWREHLGVETTWEGLVESKIWEKWAREPPLIFPGYSIAAYPDPSAMLVKRFSPHHMPWQDKDYEALIEQAAATMDHEQRLHLYRQADRLLVEEAVCIPFLYFRFHLLVKPWVRHYPTSTIQMMSWKDVLIEPRD